MARASTPQEKTKANVWRAFRSGEEGRKCVLGCCRAPKIPPKKVLNKLKSPQSTFLEGIWSPRVGVKAKRNPILKAQVGVSGDINEVEKRVPARACCSGLGLVASTQKKSEREKNMFVGWRAIY